MTIVSPFLIVRRYLSATALATPSHTVVLSRARSSNEYVEGSVLKRKIATPGTLAWFGGVLHGENVAGRILEPGDHHVARDVDVPLAREAGHVVPLERDALGLQLLHGLLDVLDLPQGGGSLVRPGELRAIDDQLPAPALVGHRGSRHFSKLLQTQDGSIELLGRFHVLDGKHRLDIGTFEHVVLLSSSPLRGLRTRW